MSSILKVSEIQDPTNGNTALTIDSSGNVAASGRLTNNNPCFHVKDSSSYTSGVLFKGNNLQIPINVGSHFDGTTGLFTAPFSGIYMFHVLTMVSGGGSIRASIRHNSATIQEHRTNDGNLGNYMQASSSVMVDMAANDTVSVIWAAGTIGGNHNEKQFMGHLVS